MSGVNWDNILSFLKNKTGLANYNGSKTEIITRCYNCEKDSKKCHGHLYLKIDENFPVYNCFRCESSGSIVKLITEFGGTPSDFLSEDILNKKFDRSKKVCFTGIRNINYSVNNRNYDDFKLKTGYLKGRLGHSIDIDDVPNLILDFESFIKENRIVLNDQQKEILPFLCTNFVGFLTIRGTQIVCRNIDETSTFRYYKLDLLEEDMTYKDFYGFKTGPVLDDMNTIVLSEGPFDLLSPYYSSRFNDLISSSCIWASVLNKRIDTMIQSVLDYCNIPKSKFIIFSDKDVMYSSDIMKNIRLHPQVQSVEFQWNTAGKDFGDRIIIPTKSIFSFKFFNK